MIVANTAAGVPTCTEREPGSTALTSGDGFNTIWNTASFVGSAATRLPP